MSGKGPGSGGGTPERTQDVEVRASIHKAQADRIEVLRGLGIIAVPRNTFVKMAVEEKLERMMEYTLRVVEVYRLAEELGAEGEGARTAEAVLRSWQRSRTEPSSEDQ